MRTAIPCLIITSLLLAGSVARADEAQKRSSQIVTIKRIEPVAAFFDLGQGAVRIVALISPGCPECERTLGQIDKLFTAVSNKRLRAYLILSPRSPESDGELEALRMFTRIKDRRVIGFWDPDNVGRTHWRAAAATESLAWDALFLYDTDASFLKTTENEPEWIHPHDNAVAPVDLEALETNVRFLLDKFEERVKAENTAPEGS